MGGYSHKLPVLLAAVAEAVAKPNLDPATWERLKDKQIKAYVVQD